MNNLKRKLNTLAIPLWLAIVMLMTSACTEENYRLNRMVFGNDLDLGGNYGDDGAGITYSTTTTNDIAIGGSNGNLYPNTPTPPNPQLSFNYESAGSSSQSYGQSGGGSATSTTVHLYGLNAIGGIYLNEVPQRSYPVSSYAVANQDFVPTGSGDDGFNFITQEFGTPLYTPLGSGWLILAAAGAGYALVKRRKKD